MAHSGWASKNFSKATSLCGMPCEPFQGGALWLGLSCEEVCVGGVPERCAGEVCGGGVGRRCEGRREEEAWAEVCIKCEGGEYVCEA